MTGARLLSLRAPSDFAFEPTVRSHGWYLLAPFRWDGSTQTLHRIERLGSGAVELRIRSKRGLLTVEADRTLDRWKRELETRLRRMFQLHLALDEFTSMASGIDTHHWVGASGFGRMLCGSTRFEDAVKIIATTNTTWRQTMRMVDLLVARAGSRTRSGGAAFPEPAQIAAIDPADLQRDCRLGYRATTIHALARGVVDGVFRLDELHDPGLSPSNQLARYRTLPGIGPYGAAHLMAMDGRHDFIAVDTEFRRFVRDRYHKGRKVADATLLRRYRKWGRWQYLAYWAESWSEVRNSLVDYESRSE
ncbi:MAG TPA: endonuclease III domain-containing protein [Thermoanaerobaculia bacterium]|nr:endonuclease III domain-containing protein [Thermoanaerobaculia bacterium]